MPRLAAPDRPTSSWVPGRGKLQLRGFLSLFFWGGHGSGLPVCGLAPTCAHNHHVWMHLHHGPSPWSSEPSRMASASTSPAFLQQQRPCHTGDCQEIACPPQEKCIPPFCRNLSYWGSPGSQPPCPAGCLLIPCSSSIVQLRAPGKNGLVLCHGRECRFQTGERRGIKEGNTAITPSPLRMSVLRGESARAEPLIASLLPKIKLQWEVNREDGVASCTPAPTEPHDRLQEGHPSSFSPGELL